MLKAELQRLRDDNSAIEALLQNLEQRRFRRIHNLRP
jgi:hypothetical protein